MSNIKIGNKGLDLIKGFESLRLDVYRCPAGIPTVGWGHVVLPGEPFVLKQKISLDEAVSLLRKDLEKFEKCVNSAVKVSINQNQFDALCSLCFNIGVAAFSGSSLVRALNSGNYTLAGEKFLAWNKATVKGKLTVLRGLTRRREAERELFNS